jgi:endonuclease YncB( thermonuclease family)
MTVQEIRLLNWLVKDGDTLEARWLIFASGRTRGELTTQRLRFLGVDAPEKWTEPGLAAISWLSTLLKRGQVVAVVELERDDKYGGVLGRIYVEQADGTRLDVIAEGLRLGHLAPYDGTGPRPFDHRTGARLTHGAGGGSLAPTDP